MRTAALGRLGAANRYVHAAVAAIAAAEPVPAPPDVPGWTDLAGRHGVLAVLAQVLAPSPELRAVRLRRALRHLAATADLALLGEVLGGAGVEWLVFKGPVLAEVVYERPGGRDCSDLDVLVRPADVPAAAAALLSAGASCKRTDWRDMLALGDGECEYRMPNGSELDLHWDVVNDGRVRAGFTVGVAELFAASRTVRVGDLPVATFGALDTALHVALHGARSGGDRLRWLLDLHQSLLHVPGPGPLLERARDFGLELVLRTMLARQRRFLGPRGVPVLPPPSAGQRVWLAADAAVTSRYPPGARYEGRFSGAIMTDSTRAGAAASWLALGRAVPGVVRGGRAAAAADARPAAR
ncbi:MAG: nucleotidyltransferase family protein [Pseudonocardia sp.]